MEREPRRPHTTFCGTATLYLSSLITDSGHGSFGF
jgi:hypothetical protein